MKNNSTILAVLLLLGAITFNLLVLWPEVAIRTPSLNDNVLHLSLVERAVEALERGEDPSDPWVSYFAQGYPVFHHYQHLPHLVTALLYKGLGEVVPLGTLFNWIRYLLLCTFPLSVYWTGRRLGFGAWQAALAGLIATLLSTDGLYGLDMGSYVWRGYGMYTQLWGMWFLGPALAGLYVTLRENRSYAVTAALLVVTLLSHTVLGYVALLSGGLFVLLLKAPGVCRRLGRLVLILLLVAVVASYFLVPFVLDKTYMNRSVWEDPSKYDAYGWEWTLTALVRGELLDAGRFPTLTLLAALGLAVCLARWRQAERYRLLVGFFGFWLLLYFGRPTWGALLNLLPMSQDLHLHRLIAPVHLGAIGLGGAGLAWLWEQALARRRSWLFAGTGLLSVALLAPVYLERIEYLATNAQWMREDATAFEAATYYKPHPGDGTMGELLADLQGRPRGRVYAGRAGNWGGAYKIGSVPVYALLAANQFDNPGYLYHALSLNADIEGYLDETRPATFNLFNLRYVIVPEDQSAPAFAQLVATYGRHRLYEVGTTGYFDLVDSSVTWYGDRSDWFEAARAWIQSTWVEAKQHPAITFGPAPPGDGVTLPLSAAPDSLADMPSLPERPCGQILSERVRRNTYVVEFEADRACWLLFKQTFHPGWRAILDDQPTSTQMLSPSFVGLAVTPGRHWAELRYDPGALRAWLRVAGLGTLTLAILAERRRNELARLMEQLRLSHALALIEHRALKVISWSPLRAAREGLGPHLPYLGGLALVTLLVGLPLLQFKIMDGHDALAYLPRTVEFYEGLKAGQLFPRWAPDLGAGYGEPTFNFNAPFIYYGASFFHAVGFGFMAAQSMALLSLLLLAGLGMYLLAGDAFGPRGGLVSAVAYLLAPYLLVTLYVRYALADFSAFAFIPLVFWGLYRFSMEGRRRFLLIGALSLASLVLSSNSISLITFPAFALLLGWLAYTEWRKDRSQVVPQLLRGLWCLVLGLGLAAFFWLPALAERGFVHVYRRLEGYLDFHDHFVYLHQFFFSPWGYGLSLAGPKDGMSFAVGPIHLLSVGAALLLILHKRLASEQGKVLIPFFIALFLLAAFCATHAAVLLWEQVSLLHPLQFPWRFLSLVGVSTAFVCGFPFLLLSPRDRRLANGLMFIMIVGLFLASFPHAKPQGFLEVQDADYTPQTIAARGVQATARQFEPIWINALPQEPAPSSRLLVLSGQVRILESRLSGTSYKWRLEAASPTQLRVATFYYPGWRLTVDGQSRPLTVENPYGLMDFALETGIHQVEVVFDRTPLRWWAEGISVGALLLLVLTVLGRVGLSLCQISAPTKLRKPR